MVYLPPFTMKINQINVYRSIYCTSPMDHMGIDGVKLGDDINLGRGTSKVFPAGPAESS